MRGNFGNFKPFLATLRANFLNLGISNKFKLTGELQCIFN